VRFYYEGIAKDGISELSFGKGGESMGFIRKRRIWWEAVPEAKGYVVYASKEKRIFDRETFAWEATDGVIHKSVNGKTELILPDDWPDFPKEQGIYYVGISSTDEVGNQSDPFLSEGVFKFLPPSPPLKGGIESL